MSITSRDAGDRSRATHPAAGAVPPRPKRHHQEHPVQDRSQKEPGEIDEDGRSHQTDSLIVPPPPGPSGHSIGTNGPSRPVSSPLPPMNGYPPAALPQRIWTAASLVTHRF